MRHRRAGRTLGRDTGHRRALYRNLARALLLSPEGRIVTTEGKAKAVIPFLHRLVTLGRRSDARARDLARRLLPDREAIGRLFGAVGPAMKDRAGGYTRILHLAGTEGRFRGRRLGDGAIMALLCWTDPVGSVGADSAGKTDAGKTEEEGKKKGGILKRLREKARARGAKAEKTKKAAAGGAT